MKTRLLYPLLFLLFLSVTVPQQKEIIYIGSKKSTVYHLKSCKYAKKIIDKNYREWKSIEAAKNAGYRACKVCKPK